jgi:HK97 gp10 family phage protein
MKLNVNIEGIEKMVSAMNALDKKGPMAMGAALWKEGERIMAKSKELVPVDMGTLRASGHVTLPQVTATGASVTLGYGGAASNYAVYVHEGTGPAVGRPAFMPPVDAIRDWAVRHGLDESLAFVVARAIGQRGLPSLKYLEKPLQEAAPDMGERIAAELREKL